MKHPRFAAWLCSAAALVLLAVPAFAQQPDALPPEDAPAAQVQTAPADVPDKDKYILGHSMGVFGYEKKTLDEVALVEMMTIDGVIKARKAIIKKLIKTGKYND